VTVFTPGFEGILPESGHKEFMDLTLDIEPQSVSLKPLRHINVRSFCGFENVSIAQNCPFQIDVQDSINLLKRCFGHKWVSLRASSD
jgi:hypothetical protein